MRPVLRALRLTATLGAITMAGVGASLACEPTPLAGEYPFLAARAASGVAGPLTTPPRPRSLNFGKTLTWHDGRTCRAWSARVVKERPAGLDDPLLSDLQVGPINGPDHRINRTVEVVCQDAASPWRTTLTLVDERTLVMPTPNGTQNLVFSRPLERSRLVEFQRQLKDMKFLTSPPSGRDDAATRRAAAAYAQYRGAAHRFEPPAITENLIDLRPPSPAAAATPAIAPSGPFVVVAVRAASDTASTLAMQEQGGQLLGAEMTFDAPMRWFDGRTCPSPSVRASDDPPVNLAEPNLSDLQVAPGPVDHRLNRAFVADCGGRAISSIVRFTMVDARVLVARTPDGAVYYVLERPLDQETALKVEQRLAGAGLDPGLIDGVLDAQARRALALYAQRLGAAYAFDRGVVTENLLETLLRPDAG